jgi:hypothetical protein
LVYYLRVPLYFSLVTSRLVDGGLSLLNDLYYEWFKKKKKTTTETCGISVASAIAGVFANFSDKIAIIMGIFEDVDKAKSWGVFCQH